MEYNKMEKQVSKKRIDEYVTEMSDNVLVDILNHRSELKKTNHNRRVIRRMEDEIVLRGLENRIK